LIGQLAHRTGMSLIGPSRYSRLVRDLVACREKQTLIRTSAEWLGSVLTRCGLGPPRASLDSSTELDNHEW
jgi:hypothetical protein